MAKFACDGCGKCCRSFGEFITLERQLSSRDYYCRSGITGELFLAHTEPEYADAIADEYEQQDGSGNDKNRKKCPFLQKDLHGDGFTCAIYPARPLICREFQCYRMLIYNSRGELCGRVIGRNDLKTTDENLKKIWTEKVAHLPHPAYAMPPHSPHKNIPRVAESPLHGVHANGSAWADTVVTILKEHGYFGDPVE